MKLRASFYRGLLCDLEFETLRLWRLRTQVQALCVLDRLRSQGRLWSAHPMVGPVFINCPELSPSVGYSRGGFQNWTSPVDQPVELL